MKPEIILTGFTEETAVQFFSAMLLSVAEARNGNDFHDAQPEAESVHSLQKPEGGRKRNVRKLLHGSQNAGA